MSRSISLSSQPLMDGEDDDQSSIYGEKNELNRYHNKTTRRWWIYAGLFQLGLIFLYTFGAVKVVDWYRAKSAPDIHAFAGLVVNYEMRMFDPFPTSIFSGEPRPESDLAWHNLMNNMTVRVTHEELAAHNQTSVELPGGGYLAWIGAFHELHCVKILRHWSWREHYQPNMTAHEKAHQMVHVDHCLEALRNAAICRADTQALAVFKWDESSPRPMLNTHRTMHRCVNWDAMMTSHEDRFVSREEVESMQNPLYEGKSEEDV